MEVQEAVLGPHHSMTRFIKRTETAVSKIIGKSENPNLAEEKYFPS